MKKKIFYVMMVGILFISCFPLYTHAAFSDKVSPLFQNQGTLSTANGNAPQKVNFDAVDTAGDQLESGSIPTNVNDEISTKEHTDQLQNGASAPDEALIQDDTPVQDEAPQQDQSSLSDKTIKTETGNLEISQNVQPEIAAELASDGVSVVGEVVRKRTPNAKHFLMSDGTYKEVITVKDQHYTDESGKLQDINTKLTDEADVDLVSVPVSIDSVNTVKSIKQSHQAMRKALQSIDRTQTPYRALQVPFDTELPKQYVNGYSIGKDNNTLNFVPVGASAVEGSAVQANEMIYEDAWPNTDVTLAVQDDGVKESLVLKNASASSTYSFKVSGMSNNSFKQGELFIQPAWLKDASGTRRPVTQTIEYEEGQALLELSADLSGLKFPVVVDPSVTIQPDGNAGKDAYVMTDNNNNDKYLNFGSDPYLMIGWPSQSYQAHYDSYIQFDLSSLPSTAILQATLSLKVASGTAAATAYLNASPWDENTVTGSTAPTINGVFQSTFGGNTPTGWDNLDITTIAQSWETGTPNYGVTISSSAQKYTYYFSSDYADPASRPQLIISYNPVPSAPTVVSPHGGETVDAQYLITWNPSVDETRPQSSLQYEIQLSTNGGTSWTDIVPLTAAGVTSYSYNFSSQPSTTTALVRVRSADVGGYSSWGQSAAPFTIKHNQAPNAPTSLTPGSTSSSASTLTTLTPTLAWTFTDPDTGDTQSAYEVLIYNGTTLVKDSGWVTSTLKTYTVPTSLLARNITYNWKVLTKDQSGAASVASALYYIKTNTLPVAAITSYSNGQQLTINTLTFTWTYTDGNSQVQTSYQILGSQDNWATTGYNSGVLSGSATTFTTPALASGTWNFKLLVMDGLEWSNAALRSNLVLPNTFEPNDASAQAFQINYNQSYNSIIDSGTDVDFFKFTATANEIDRFVLNVPSGINYDVYFYDSSMKLITAGVQAAGTAENELLDVKSGNVYYIKIIGVGGNYSTTMTYNFILTPASQQSQTTYTYDSNGNILTKTTTSS